MHATQTLAVDRTLTLSSIQQWLIANLSKSLDLRPSDIDVGEPFASYGLSSVAAVSLTGDLEDWLGMRLLPTLAWDYPSIELLAQHLAEELQQRPSPAVAV
ncbi:MAG: acyl carrier protein [Pyrinomonadaceae bacterium]|nr:acyl carrier protein [Pyrinomonadaceae bacterium]